jgi:hypothetical protein
MSAARGRAFMSEEWLGKQFMTRGEGLLVIGLLAFALIDSHMKGEREREYIASAFAHGHVFAGQCQRARLAQSPDAQPEQQAAALPMRDTDGRGYTYEPAPLFGYPYDGGDPFNRGQW